MSEPVDGKGSCLCGAIHMTATKLNPSVGACHCNMCRKWGGGPLLVIDCGSNVIFEGEEHLKCYQSSEWAERGYCTHCGTHLFYRMKESKQHFVPVGIFDNDTKFIFDHQVFIDEKPSYYCFSNETKDMTGDEVIAQFSSE